MAKPGFYQHRKFQRLVRILGEPPPHVRGYVEFMWETGYAAGIAFLGDAEDVEIAAQFPGEQGTLVAALLTVGLIDEVEPGKYEIHDFLEHAPEYVVTRARKAALRAVERTCAHCGEPFRSGEPHAKFCCNSCRVTSHRTAKLTQGNADLRYCNAGVTQVNAVPRTEQNRTDLIQEVAAQPSSSAEPNDTPSEEKPPRAVVEFLDAWNAIQGVTACRKLTPKRAKALRARMGNADWRASWREALARVAASSFCTGGGKRNWRADVDWFLRPDTVTRILEGQFDNPRDSPTRSETIPEKLKRLREEGKMPALK